MGKEMEEFAKVLLETINNQDREKMADLYADDAVYTAGGPARGSEYVGKEAVLGAIQRATNQVFLVKKMEVKKVITGEDAVVLPISVKGSSRITGKPYANELLLIFEVKDGKIKHMREYLDTIASARATGDLPYPDE